ncbi:hypothetical protein [Nostoc sp. UHCC 0251]|nr:hypothetical protein [Nostoc sp. UHCC 0251]MEA5626799.1 hypothetical protein [Nostoc sp. UHCC 0251]
MPETQIYQKIKQNDVKASIYTFEEILSDRFYPGEPATGDLMD